MIKEENPGASQLSRLLHILQQVCSKLNNCLPQTQQVQFTTSMQSIWEGLEKLTQKIIKAIHGYEHILQNLEDNLRKHIKNQIQLKLYYEHLEDVIVNLKKERDQNCSIIGTLQTELTLLKDKDKYYQMTTSNHNTRHNQDGHPETKLDTITKIKNRLSLNGTEEFYTSYLTKKMEKDSDTKQLRDKRQSLANALKQLYESPVQTKPPQKKQPKVSIKPKSKQKQPLLNRSKSSKRSLNSSVKSTDRSKQRGGKKSKEKKQEKDYLKSTFNNISSRRNSKS